jgi:hypothetical protein
MNAGGRTDGMPSEAREGGDAAPASSMRKPLLVWIALALVLVSVALVRSRLAEMPLERDEGEYAYAGRMILEGYAPYEYVYSMKLPGIYVAYAGLLMVFGETPTAIHRGLIVINAVSVVLFFLLVRRLFDPWTGLVAAATFAFLAMGAGVQGLFANAEHFVLPFALGGLLMLLRALESGRRSALILAGALLGTGLVVKQHGLAFVLIGSGWLVAHDIDTKPRDWKRVGRRLGLLVGGAMVPYLVTCLFFLGIGAFEDFWFWTFSYARSYTQQAPWSEFSETFRQSAAHVGREARWIWWLAILGLSTPAWWKPARIRWPFLLSFALGSFLAVCPGFLFRPHYFVFTLPAAGLFFALLVAAVGRYVTGIPRSLAALPLGALILGSSAFGQREYLFESPPLQVAWRLYAGNPFRESVEVGRWLRENTREGDRVAVIGSEPQLLFYSGRRSATGFMYTYALMEDHDYALQMQRDLRREVLESEPRYVVFSRNRLSWLQRPESHTLILEWFSKYASESLELRATWDLFPNGTIRSYEGPSLAQRAPRFLGSLEVYERVR